MSYVTGKMIKELREKKKLTQKDLAEKLQISDKTISKWETDRGLPDISIIGTLSETLGVSIAELLVGEYAENGNRSANMRKTKFYVCPICGNVIHAIGKGSFCCCGIQLPALEAEDDSTSHQIKIELIENEYYVSSEHPMTKEHYISFIAYLTDKKIEMTKLYPEQMIECRFMRQGHGKILMYCNQHGLFQIKV